MRHADAHLEAAGVGRLVAEQQQVERALGRLELADRGGDRTGGALRVPVRPLDRPAGRPPTAPTLTA